MWYQQTAYSLKTPLLVGATGGDSASPTVTIDNNRAQAIDCKISLLLPEGWTTAKGEASATVKPGEKMDIEFPFTVNLLESQGIKETRLIVSEGQKLKEIPFRVMIQPALVMQVAAIVGPPGPASATVKVLNLSARSQNANLRIKVPEGWKVPTSTISITDLKPKEQRFIPVALTWSPNWKPQESAFVELDAGLGKPLVQPLIPNEYRLYPAGKIKLDGDLSDWPAAAQLPNWILGSTLGAAQARVFLAWAKEGVYGAVEAHDSRAVAKDPRSFWTCDVLELFIDTRNNKQPRAYEAGDHQFWFVPLLEQNRVYVGQWKRAAELNETQFDIPGIQSAARRTADGYVMEFLLPASLLKRYQPAAGNKIGLGLNLTVHGQQSDREVYWPAAKASGAPAHPEHWGALELSTGQ